MKYADLTSTSSPSEVLRLSPNGDTVRITLAYFDAFDGAFDKETLIGDFDIDRLKAALASLDRPTGAVPLAPIAQHARQRTFKDYFGGWK